MTPGCPLGRHRSFADSPSPLAGSQSHRGSPPPITLHQHTSRCIGAIWVPTWSQQPTPSTPPSTRIGATAPSSPSSSSALRPGWPGLPAPLPPGVHRVGIAPGPCLDHAVYAWGDRVAWGTRAYTSWGRGRRGAKNRGVKEAGAIRSSACMSCTSGLAFSFVCERAGSKQAGRRVGLSVSLGFRPAE